MPPMTALILEDNSECRDLLAEMLAERGMKVTQYSDPESYLAARSPEDCANGCPCVNFILTDNHMLKMTGLEYLEQRKEKGCKFNYDRAAIISGNLSNEEIKRARQLGCRIFIKPFKIDAINLWLDEHMDQVA